MPILSDAASPPSRRLGLGTTKSSHRPAFLNNSGRQWNGRRDHRCLARLLFAKAIGEALARHRAETLARVKEAITEAAAAEAEPKAVDLPPAEPAAELIELPAILRRSAA